MIESKPFYWLRCDRCGETSTQDGDYRAWESVESAYADAYDADWSTEGGNHLCYDCQPHPPDWDDEHEAAFKGESELDCDYCSVHVWEADPDAPGHVRLKIEVPMGRVLEMFHDDR